ncbi:thiamine pyrophosphate-binding protein [Streptomyces sp. NPDC001817]|uniref:thiamine pyrophosphate-binding protein n=1 Tax=Streptomyces sp. NPDC001817 TaxID=3154398 RepID=UPI0033314C77
MPAVALNTSAAVAPAAPDARTGAVTPAVSLAGELRRGGFAPFLATPCGILAPLLCALQDEGPLITVSREDNAVGMAAGCAIAGEAPVVLMQNSGLGQSVNALASLVVPYAVPMLLVVSLRGTDLDHTPENTVMGRITQSLLDGMDIPWTRLVPGADTAGPVERARRTVLEERRTAALLVPPALFGWTP